MKINYTDYMKTNKRPSTMSDAEKRKVAADIKAAMQARDIHGHVDVTYYEDAALVNLDGKYYGVWDYGRKAFFSGAVGDYDD